MTSWDISKPLPKQYFPCDSFGKHNTHGKYVAWPIQGAGPNEISADTIYANVPGGTLAKEKCYIVKVVKPHVREKPFPYKFALENPVNLKDKKIARKLKNKLNTVLTKLGVSYVDRIGVITTQNDVAVTSWFVKNGKEGVAINPYWVLKKDMHIVNRLIKKEVIHKALFRNLHELTNKPLLNFTLDIISMRIIAQTSFDRLDKQTVRLAEMLINPKVYKKYPLMALLDCSLSNEQAKKLPASIYNIWAQLYKTSASGFLPSLSGIKISSIYFQLKPYFDDLTQENFGTNAGFNNEGKGREDDKFGGNANYPFNIEQTEKGNAGNQQGQGNGQVFKDSNLPPEGDRQTQRVEKNVRESFVPRRFKYARHYNNTLTDFWDTEVVHKKELTDKRLKDFAKKWRTQKLLETVEGKIKQTLQRENVKIDPYPQDLTDDGVMFMALGISGNVFPFFFNHAPDEKNNRKKVAAFFDLSPSMTGFFPYMVKMVESLEQECDIVLARNAPDEKDGYVRGAYGFAGNVSEITEEELEDMKKGKIKAGASTCFNSILKHVFSKIKEDNIDIVLCFTDGFSNLDASLIDEFNKTNKLFYRIYFKHYSGTKKLIEDDEAEKLTDMTSDLDNLNGESFTLHLPYADGNI